MSHTHHINHVTYVTYHRDSHTLIHPILINFSTYTLLYFLAKAPKVFYWLNRFKWFSDPKSMTA